MTIFRAWVRALRGRHSHNPNASPQAPAASDSGLSPIWHESILLVNTDADVRDLLVQTLVKAGYEVCNIGGLSSAQAYLRQNINQPSLLILRVEALLRRCQSY